MSVMIFFLVLGIILIPIFIWLMKFLYREWCLSRRYRAKSEDLLWYLQITLKFFLVDILVVVVDLSFIVELLRRY